MPSTPKLRVLSGVVTVLVIAAVAFVVRGALQGDDDPTPPLPTIAGTVTTEQGDPDFTLKDLTRNVIPKGASTIATAKAKAIRVYAKPKGKHAKNVRQRVFNGQRIPLTFLVRSRRKGWVQVDLPTRPNQSRGWVHRTDVKLAFTRLKIEVLRKKHRLRLLDTNKVLFETKIGVGRSVSPTPPGRYFVTDIVKPKNPSGFYGPYALGLSAHSQVYSSFEGGDGQVGIHGTNAPAGLGTDVSHGCIRVENKVISRLAKLVPLGTPVLIQN